MPPGQLALANTTVSKYGYDQTGQVDYQFNQHGFRGSEFIGNRSIFFLGNSTTFGIGVKQQDTFASQLSTTLDIPFGNLSFGAFYHENHDHLTNLARLLERDQDDIFVVQINNLDRRRVNSELVVGDNNKKYCMDKFLNYFDLVNTMLKGRDRLFIYWDNIDYNIPESIQKEILIYNKFHVDLSLPNNPKTFGQASHRAIYKILLAKIGQFNKCS